MKRQFRLFWQEIRELPDVAVIMALSVITGCYAGYILWNLLPVESVIIIPLVAYLIHRAAGVILFSGLFQIYQVRSRRGGGWIENQPRK